MAKAGVKYLEVDCFLCEKPRLTKPNDDWLIVGDMGPHRRAHGVCFREVCVQLRDIRRETDNPLAMLEMVEERERKRGVEPPTRDPQLIAQLVREHEWFKDVRNRGKGEQPDV